MVLRLPSIISAAKQALKLSKSNGVPRGHVAVYVGDKSEEKKRYVVPLSCLSHPTFQNLLSPVEEEFGFNHPMGGLTIPCNEQTFANDGTLGDDEHEAPVPLPLLEADEDIAESSPLSGRRHVERLDYKKLYDRLYESFKENQYPDRLMREKLANELGLTPQRVRCIT